MLQGLFNIEIIFKDPKTVFDGLGENVTGYKEMVRLDGRIRRLSARELYNTQGQDEVSSHRVYIMGSKADHPYAKLENIMEIDGENYKIQTVEQGQTRHAHHLQIDCIKVLGV